MKVLIQGMRRSGTTVAFDVLCQDPRFDAWYEPFGPAKEGARGGGSGLQDVAFPHKTRALRERMCAEGAPLRDPAFFNYGAPRDARLELEPELPEPCLAYLRRMLEGAPDVLLKFVRAYEKIPLLRRLAPDAKLVHVVRDPRSVVASQLLSRARRSAPPKEERLFAKRGEGGLWASRALAEALRARPLYAGLDDPSDVERILLVWRHTFARTRQEGLAHFRADYLLLRHEELCAAPRRGVGRLLAFLGLAPAPAILDWAAAQLRAPAPPLFPESPRWRSAFRRVGMDRELEEAGYGELLAGGGA
jgi:hypothetical protein